LVVIDVPRTAAPGLGPHLSSWLPLLAVGANFLTGRPAIARWIEGMAVSIGDPHLGVLRGLNGLNQTIQIKLGLCI